MCGKVPFWPEAKHSSSASAIRRRRREIVMIGGGQVRTATFAVALVSINLARTTPADGRDRY